MGLSGFRRRITGDRNPGIAFRDSPIPITSPIPIGTLNQLLLSRYERIKRAQSILARRTTLYASEGDYTVI